MEEFISNFKKWNKVTEKRQKETLGNQRVIAKSINNDTFKIKLIRDLDVLDANKQLTPKGWEGLKAWVLKFKEIQQKYGNRLNDPKGWKVTYDVKKDKREGKKQVITFTLVPVKSINNPPPGQIINISQVKPETKKIVAGSMNQGINASDPEGGNETDAADVAKGAKETVEDSKDTEIDETALPLTKDPNKEDPNVRAYQKLIVNKIDGTPLANHAGYKKFKSYGTDGRYGNWTGNITKALKLGYEMSETDPNTVTAELIQKLKTEPIVESYLWNSKIIEAFNIDASIKYLDETVRKSTKKTGTKKTSAKGTTPAATGKEETEVIKGEISGASPKDSLDDADKAILKIYKDSSGDFDFESVYKYLLKLVGKSQHILNSRGKEDSIFEPATMGWFYLKSDCAKIFSKWWTKEIYPKYIKLYNNIKTFEKLSDWQAMLLKTNIKSIHKLRKTIYNNILSTEDTKLILTNPMGNEKTYILSSAFTFASGRKKDPEEEAAAEKAAAEARKKYKEKAYDIKHVPGA